MRIEGALARMDSLGGVCHDLAQLGSFLLSIGRIHIYVIGKNGVTDDVGGGFASEGMGEDGFMGLEYKWTDIFFDAARAARSPAGQARNLQTSLAHELDHLRNKDHIDDAAGGYLTPNTQHCGGF